MITFCRHIGFGLAAVTGFVAISGLAVTPAVATVYNFLLNDHPDGGAADPLYGLRLDGLLDGSSGTYTFTFSDGATFLDYDDNGTATGADDSIRIHGVARGGLDTGTSWAQNSPAGALVEIDFNYRLHIADPVNLSEASNAATANTVVRTTTDDDASKVPGAWDASVGNTGTISLGLGWGANEGEVIRLVDEAGSHPYSFRFDNSSNHRNAGTGATFSGWGWMNHDGGGNALTHHVYSSDWLFTATYLSEGTPTSTPEPATLALFGVGLAGIGLGLRRRRT